MGYLSEALDLALFEGGGGKARLRPGSHSFDLTVPGREYASGEGPMVKYFMSKSRRAVGFSSSVYVYDVEPPTGEYEAKLLAVAGKSMGVSLKWKSGSRWEKRQYADGWSRSVEVEGELGVARDKELAAAMDKVVAATVYDLYDGWRAGRLRSEPQITGSFIRDYLAQSGAVPQSFREGARGDQTNMVHAAIKRLLRKGKIGKAHGIGGFNYEPNEAWWKAK